METKGKGHEENYTIIDKQKESLANKKYEDIEYTNGQTRVMENKDMKITIGLLTSSHALFQIYVIARSRS